MSENKNQAVAATSAVPTQNANPAPKAPLAAVVKAASTSAVARSHAPTLHDFLRRQEAGIKAALPAVMTPERFTRLVTSALSANPKLKECTPESFLGSVMTAAQLGVEPNTPLGQAYLIPYKNNKRNPDGSWSAKLECQFQLGYKGLIELAARSGLKEVYAETVYEGDEFEYELGLNRKLRHKPAMANRGNAIGYYAVYKTVTDGVGLAFMSREDVEQFARSKSKAYDNGPWQTDFDAMAKKTVLKQALKYAPLKVEFQRQVAADETIKVDIDKDMTTVNPVKVVDVEALPPEPVKAEGAA